MSTASIKIPAALSEKVSGFAGRLGLPQEAVFTSLIERGLEYENDSTNDPWEWFQELHSGMYVLQNIFEGYAELEDSTLREPWTIDFFLMRLSRIVEKLEKFSFSNDATSLPGPSKAVEPVVMVNGERTSRGYLLDNTILHLPGWVAMQEDAELPACRIPEVCSAESSPPQTLPRLACVQLKDGSTRIGYVSSFEDSFLVNRGCGGSDTISQDKVEKVTPICAIFAPLPETGSVA